MTKANCLTCHTTEKSPNFDYDVYFLKILHEAILSHDQQGFFPPVRDMLPESSEFCNQDLPRVLLLKSLPAFSFRIRQN